MQDIEPYIPKILKNVIFIVGEAPGAEEQKIGLPFVGKAGKLLDEALELNGIDRTLCYITNVFWERPPNNKVDYFFSTATQAAKNDIEISEHYLGYRGKILHKKHESELLRLFNEIIAVEPRVVLCLGSTPLWALTGDTGITKARGKWTVATNISPWEKSVEIMPTWHPSAVMRDRKIKFPEFCEDISHVIGKN